MSDIVDRGSCPGCGAPLPLGKSGGTVACEYCKLVTSYTVAAPSQSPPSGIDQLAQIVVVPLYERREVLVVGWNGATLEAYEPQGRKSSWSVQIARTRHSIEHAFERVYLCTDAGEFVAIDSATGYVAFVAALPSPPLRIADLLGPTQPSARVLVHCANGALVALDRMSGQIVERWQIATTPACWIAEGGRLLVGPVGNEAWLLDPMRREPVARTTVPALGGCITGGLAYIAGHGGQHAAIDINDGRVAWQGAAPWNPATGARAAFARELFVADGARLTAMPTGHSVMAAAPIDEVVLIAATVIVRAGPHLVGYRRTLEPAWSTTLPDVERVQVADNGRMLVVALVRGGQVWLRGLLPSTGQPRWNVLVPDGSDFVGHAIVGDFVQAESATHRFVLRADSGQLLWSSTSSAAR